MMRTNVPQRQMLPSRPLRICSGVAFGMLLEQRHGRHDEARRAEAAHQRVDVAERLLHRVQRVAPLARPSTVRICLPCTSMASVEHE